MLSYSGKVLMSNRRHSACFGHAAELLFCIVRADQANLYWFYKDVHCARVSSCSISPTSVRHPVVAFPIVLSTSCCQGCKCNAYFALTYAAPAAVRCNVKGYHGLQEGRRCEVCKKPASLKCAKCKEVSDEYPCNNPPAVCPLAPDMA